MKTEHYAPELSNDNERAREVTTMLQLAVEYVDDCCGQGAAEANPAIVAAWMQAYATLHMANTLREEIDEMKVQLRDELRQIE